MAGLVYLKDRRIEKASEKIDCLSEIFIKEKNKYVSRGGLKLEGIMQDASINPKGSICLDIGASTGGFTDYLIKNNAQKVIALDVGHGLIDQGLRNNSKVVLIEKTNFKNINFNQIGQKFDLITIDVSFISLKNILPKTKLFVKPGGKIIALLKPQFELPSKDVPKGIVKDIKLIEILKLNFSEFITSLNLNLLGFYDSKLKGTKGNQEYFLVIEAPWCT
ncbi:MAG: TlyA family RNA methyltransferase [Pseudomonadota bacterium]